jgi:ABC-type molybdate transport system substrate-binding protein
VQRNQLLIAGVAVICAVCIGIAAFSATGGTLPGTSPATITVMMPYDQNIGSVMTKLAGDYGKTHNVKIELTSVKGRQGMVNEITSGNVSPDLVIIEKEYRIFNLSGLAKLQQKDLVENSTFLCRSDAVMVVPQGSQILNTSGITGKKVAMVDMVKYHGPGGCLANYIVADLNATVTPVLVSGIPQAYGAVADSSADATCIWRSEFIDLQASTHNNLTAVSLPAYGMDNYLALMKNAKNPSEAASFMDYVLAHKDQFNE